MNTSKPIDITDIRSIGPVRAPDNPRTVSMCETQPVTAEGLRAMLGAQTDLRFGHVCDSLQEAAALMLEETTDVLILDKGFGMQAVLEWLEDWKRSLAYSPKVGIVVWGASITEAEALRFLQAGARGFLRKTAGVEPLLSCLRTVAGGGSWMVDCVFGENGRTLRCRRSELTLREQQVLELVEQGYKNKEIAADLGIQPGTVKIHLKHVFQKIGVRGRYGLVISGLQERGSLPLSA
jgi:DNA-binding NarL/FixJ family response regulator